jgi:hypothetical protein
MPSKLCPLSRLASTFSTSKRDATSASVASSEGMGQPHDEEDLIQQLEEEIFSRISAPPTIEGISSIVSEARKDD